MPKTAQGSWVGTQAQPQFQQYQTAGMLQPAAPPVALPPPASTASPVPSSGVSAPLPPDLLGQLGGGLFIGNTENPMPVAPPADDQRARLVRAVLGVARMGPRGSTLGKF